MLVPSSCNLGELLQRAQAGSDEAAQCVFDRYRQPLLAVIRQILSYPLRKLYDSDDFLLAAFTEIFARKFTEEVLASPQVFWPYLQKVAVNKVRDAKRKYLFSQRHNIRHEISLETIPLREEAASRDLSPDESLLLKELVEERLVALLTQLSPVLRGIIQLILQGHNGNEIAHMLQLEPKRVYRAMHWLRRKLDD